MNSMNDVYTEQLVKRKTPGSAIIAKAGLIALTLFSATLLFRIPYAILILVGLIALDVFLFKRMDLEYEYQYVNGDLDIDKIMAKSKRKRIFSTNIEELELLAPTGSSELRLIKVDKTLNYSTLVPGNKTYELVVIQKGQKVKVIFEPNETILNGFQMYAPRKVII